MVEMPLNGLRICHANTSTVEFTVEEKSNKVPNYN